MRQYALPVQGLGFSTPALSVSPSLEWLKDPCFKSVIYETEERKEQENKAKLIFSFSSAFELIETFRFLP